MGTRLRRARRVVLFAAVVSAAWWASPAGAEEGALGQFDGHGDVGSPRLPGRTTYNAVSQEYGFSAAGVNMWGPRDEFHFAWKRWKGDFLLRAEVRFEGTGADPHRKAGVIVRRSLDADSPYADAVVHGDGLTSLQFRRAKGALTEEVRSETTGAGRAAAREEGHDRHPKGGPLRRDLHAPAR